MEFETNGFDIHDKISISGFSGKIVSLLQLFTGSHDIDYESFRTMEFYAILTSIVVEIV